MTPKTYYPIASTDKICCHCDEIIEAGEQYYYAKEKYSTNTEVKRKVYMYHIKCKRAREVNTNNNKLLTMLMKEPMFTDEIHKHISKNSENQTYRRLVGEGYPINKFKFLFRGQSSKQQRLDRTNTRGYCGFIIMYLDGMEAEAVLKILERFPNQKNNWRDLFTPILGKVPHYIRDAKDTLLKHPETFKKVFKTHDLKTRKMLIRNLINKEMDEMKEKYDKKFEERFND